MREVPWTAPEFAIAAARAGGVLPRGLYRVVVLESSGQLRSSDFGSLASAQEYANDVASESDHPSPLAWSSTTNSAARPAGATTQLPGPRPRPRIRRPRTQASASSVTATSTGQGRAPGARRVGHRSRQRLRHRRPRSRLLPPPREAGGRRRCSDRGPRFEGRDAGGRGARDRSAPRQRGPGATRQPGLPVRGGTGDLAPRGAGRARDRKAATGSRQAHRRAGAPAGQPAGGDAPARAGRHRQCPPAHPPRRRTASTAPHRTGA